MGVRGTPKLQRHGSALLFILVCFEGRRYHFELVDMKGTVPELRRNPGLTEWVVWDKQMKDDQFYTKHSDVAEGKHGQKRKQYRETMFPPQHRAQCAEIKDSVHDFLHLDRCMRFLPHYHDTGGFFVAVIRKTENAEWVKAKGGGNGNEEKEEKKEDGDGMLSDERLAEIEKKQFGRHRFDDISPYHPMSAMTDYKVEIAKLVAFYGLRVDEEAVESFSDLISFSNSFTRKIVGCF